MAADARVVEVICAPEDKENLETDTCFLPFCMDIFAELLRTIRAEARSDQPLHRRTSVTQPGQQSAPFAFTF